MVTRLWITFAYVILLFAARLQLSAAPNPELLKIIAEQSGIPTDEKVSLQYEDLKIPPVDPLNLEKEIEKIIEEIRKENDKKLENASYVLTLLGGEGNICARSRK